MKLRGTLATPRKVAWVLLIAGIAWFIHISPRTPLEFFDAAMRDQEIIQQYKMEKYDTIDLVGAAEWRKLEELFSCHRRVGRIALLYDIANNPQRVEEERLSIVDGFYEPDERTGAILRANDPIYRALATELDTRRKENQAKNIGLAANNVGAKAATDKVFMASIFKTEMERSLLRQFQMRLFWQRTR